MLAENLIEIHYGNNIQASSNMSRAELTETARLAFAAKLFHDGKITLGQAAELYGQGKVEFMETLINNDYSCVNLQAEDAEDELSFAHAH